MGHIFAASDRLYLLESIHFQNCAGSDLVDVFINVFQFFLRKPKSYQKRKYIPVNPSFLHSNEDN